MSFETSKPLLTSSVRYTNYKQDKLKHYKVRLTSPWKGTLTIMNKDTEDRTHMKFRTNREEM